MPLKFCCRSLLLILILITALSGKAQRFLSDYDSSLFLRDTLTNVVKRLENLHFSGYMQPQFQVAEAEGASTYDGGNFLPNSNNRFMLRRARVKIDYLLSAKNKNMPKALFTFQFEATERDLNIRDMFVRIYEPAKNNFALTMGLFARPFGFEVNLSSAYRETPERGRMSQILLPSERDLGAMVSYESQNRKKKNPLFKFDVGVFNGQGKSGPAEFDSYKDVISRWSLKEWVINRQWTVSGGLSGLWGGWRQATKYKYEMDKVNGKPVFSVDSSLNNIGGKAPRQYAGADVQIIHKHGWGKTEVRGEYWAGKQSGTETSTVNPGSLPLTPTYIRQFNGAFFYFLQNIINSKWELMAKYDWYDPNVKVAKKDIGAAQSNLDIGDIKFSTFGFGLTRYFTGNLKVLAYYSMVNNEATTLPGYGRDLNDNVFTFRMQLRF